MPVKNTKKAVTSLVLGLLAFLLAVTAFVLFILGLFNGEEYVSENPFVTITSTVDGDDATLNVVFYNTEKSDVIIVVKTEGGFTEVFDGEEEIKVEGLDPSEYSVYAVRTYDDEEGYTHSVLIPVGTAFYTTFTIGGNV